MSPAAPPEPRPPSSDAPSRAPSLRDRPQPRTLVQATGAAFFPIAFLARFPYAMIVVGTLTLVTAARDSIALAGLNAAVVGLGSAVVGPLLGAAADRWGQRPVLLLAGAANALALLAMSAVAFSDLPDQAVLAVGFLIGATAPQVSPMSRSRLVGIVLQRLPSDRHIRALNGTMAYESAVDETAFVFGPVVVGLLATTMTPAAPMVGAAVLTVLFVTAFALHPSATISAPRPGVRPEQAPVRELVEARVLVVVAGAFGVGLFFGTMLTSLTAAMTDQGRGSSAGLVYGVMGVGSTVLALAVALFPVSFTLRWRWLVFGGVMLLATIGYGLADGLTGLVGAMAVAGIGIGPVLVTIFSLTAARSPEGRSATVMTMVGSAVVVGQSAASAVTGEIAERLDTATALWLPVVAAACVVLAALWNSLQAGPSEPRHLVAPV